MSLNKLRTAAPIALAFTGAAIAQPVYEIGHQYNGEPEVVETHPEPFGAGQNPVTVDGYQRYSTMYFPWTQWLARQPGLMVSIVQVDARTPDDPRPDFSFRNRASVTFTDLVFTSPQSEPISVDLSMAIGTSPFILDQADGNQAVVLFEYEVELEGDTRVGASRLTFTGTEFVRERTGLMEGLPPDRVVVLEGFTVPVNTPVSLRIEAAKSFIVPAATGRLRLDTFGGGQSDIGFKLEGPLFVVPDGVGVNSDQAQILDNDFVYCRGDLDGDLRMTVFDYLEFFNLFMDGDSRADLDFDGEFTVFDFLAYLNLYDMGCL